MKIVRRLYFYTVAFISMEVVLWGLISLLRSIFNPKIVTDSAQALAQAIALILVGVPIFLVHWLWAQRTSAKDEEEKTSSLRAIYLYGALMATLVPVVQNILALVDRLLLGAGRLSMERALIGGSQTLSDNLIAISMNLLIALYFWNVLRNDWRSLPELGNFKDVFRLYRHLWLLYSLLMVIFGAQQVLRYVFYVPAQTIGVIGQETLVNGMALLVLGTPIWFYVWQLCQSALVDVEENESQLRLGVLYLLALSGVITVLASGGNLLYAILDKALGDSISNPDLMQKVGVNLSVLLPFSVLWGYYGGWLSKQIKADTDRVRSAAKRRVYLYILSALGLTTSFIGISSLISLIIDLALRNEPVGGPVFRQHLAASMAVLAVGIPLWLLTWLPMQTEAREIGDPGDHSRRSVIRKAYLYLAMFAGVIGGMVAAVGLVFELLQAVLSNSTDPTFLTNVLNALQLLALFLVLLLYHLLCLRQDNFSTTTALESLHAAFQVAILDHNGRFGPNLQAVLMKQAPKLPVKIIQSSEKIPSDFTPSAVVLPGSLAISPSETLATWLRDYKGSRLVVTDESQNLIWDNDLKHAAKDLQALAEGQQIPSLARRGSSAWTIVIYVFAGLFAIELVFFLLALIIPTFID
jgi:hypothetical protein